MEYYSIHNLLKIATNVDIPVPEYFKLQKPIRNPDVEILQVPLGFKKSKENVLMRTNYYFWRKKNTLFIDFNVANAKLAIEDIFGKTRIRCTKALRKLSTKESWNRLVEAVLWFKLIKRGYTFVHAGALSYNGKEGVLIAAPADTGKTSTVLSLLSTGRFGFMTDDAVLLGNGFAYSYPEKVKVSPYTLTGNIRVARSWKRKIFKSRLLGLFSERLLRMKITDLYKIPDELIVDKNPIKKIFILTGHDREGIVRKIERKRAARILLFPSVEVSTFMHRYMELYYYLFNVDTFSIVERINKIIERSFKNAECFELKTPYLGGYAETIAKIMG